MPKVQNCEHKTDHQLISIAPQRHNWSFFSVKLISKTIFNCNHFSAFFSLLFCKFNKLSGFWTHQFYFVLLSNLNIINSWESTQSHQSVSLKISKNIPLRQNAHNLIIVCNFLLLHVVFFLFSCFIGHQIISLVRHIKSKKNCSQTRKTITEMKVWNAILVDI